MAEPKLRLATASLAGCFGCHMSLLDMDEALFGLLDRIEFDRTPLTDIKHCGACDIGLIEGGVCNAENVHVLKEFRRNCRLLVALGACAITGGIPALRNHIGLRACFQEVYEYEVGVVGHTLPSDPELPLPFDRVHPINEVVKVDYFLPGCPPPAEAIRAFLVDLVSGRTPGIAPELLHYD